MIVLAALGLGVGILPASATGDSSTGGLAPTPIPRISGVQCRATCVASDETPAGGVVRVRGRNLGETARVVFLGRSGYSADDVGAGVRRRDAHDNYVDVRVPGGARSGPVEVVTRDGVASKPSRVGITIDHGMDLRGPGSLSAHGLAARIESRVVYYAGRRGARLAYAVTGSRPLSVRIDLVRVNDGAVVATWSPGEVAPGATHSVEWHGGTSVGDARLQFELFTGSAAARTASNTAHAASPSIAAAFLYLQHIFPIRGRHNYGDAQNRFGDDRGDHRHAGQDVLANCGTALVAARGGRVLAAGYGGAGGNFVAIHGAGSRFDTVYMHLRDTPLVHEGQRVYTGQLIGFVGETGDASVCHLHFELWDGPWFNGGHVIDPLPSLLAWDRLS